MKNDDQKDNTTYTNGTREKVEFVVIILMILYEIHSFFYLHMLLLHSINS